MYLRILSYNYPPPLQGTGKSKYPCKALCMGSGETFRANRWLCSEELMASRPCFCNSRAVCILRFLRKYGAPCWLVFEGTKMESTHFCRLPNLEKHPYEFVRPIDLFIDSQLTSLKAGHSRPLLREATPRLVGSIRTRSTERRELNVLATLTPE